MKPLKILSVATTYPRWKNDTEPPFVHDLNRHLVERGHQVTVLVPHAPGAKKQELLDGVSIERFTYASEGSENIFYNGGAIPNLKNSWKAKIILPKALWALRKCIQQKLATSKPDIFHVHWLLPQGYFALKPSAKARVPLVVTGHGVDVHQVAQGLMGALAKKVISEANAITANTRTTANLLNKLAPPRRLDIIPMGFDLNLFSPEHKDPALKKSWKRAGPFIMGLGRMVEKKGFRYLLEAMPKILEKFPDAQLLLAGDGPEYETLKNYAIEQGVALSVTFLGALDRKDVARYLATADVFAGPSIIDSKGDTEGQGVVFVEAMASGIPIVATEVGGIPDVIDHEKTGLLVQEKNSAELANAIIQTLSDPSASKERTIRARAQTPAYAWPGIAEKFESLFYALQPTRNK